MFDDDFRFENSLFGPCHVSPWTPYAIKLFTSCAYTLRVENYARLYQGYGWRCVLSGFLALRLAEDTRN
jgi:hypothetical protein